MYCPKCGWHNVDDAARCANCSQQLQAPQAGTPQQPQQVPGQSDPQQGYQQYGDAPAYDVPNYLAWSISVTVLSFICCVTILGLPFGIVAIVKSISANNKKLANDYYGAVADASAAKTWALVSTVLVIIGGAFGIIALVGVILSGSSNGFQ